MDSEPYPIVTHSFTRLPWGVRPGDLTTQAGRQSIEGPDDVMAAVKRARDANQDYVLLLRHRDENSIFVPLPIDGKTG